MTSNLPPAVNGLGSVISRYDLILCDLAMPDLQPLEGDKAVRAAAPDTPLIVVTGTEDDEH